MDNTWFEYGFASSPYMAILRGYGTTRTLELARAGWQIGIDLVEVPVQSSEDLAVLGTTVQAGRALGRHVGAGTVRTAEQVEAVVDAGAAFIVSPGLNEDVVRAAARRGIPALPGVATASEVDRALAWGLTWLKAFPAVVLGPAWITQMHGPFPTAQFVATGGISTANAEDFLRAGARGVAVGSAIEELAGQAV